jgi:hypothetical protein
LEGLAVFCTAPTLIDCLIFKDRSLVLKHLQFKRFLIRFEFCEEKDCRACGLFCQLIESCNSPYQQNLTELLSTQINNTKTARLLSLSRFVFCEERNYSPICAHLQTQHFSTIA